MTSAHASSGSAYEPSAPASPWKDPSGPIEGADAIRVVVLSGYGLNCEAESAAGFGMVGARVDVVHLADLIERGPVAFDDTHILVFSGGFSFGDHIASGRVFANRVRYRLGDALARYVDDGGLVLGICNGFQTIVKLGLVPGIGRAPERLTEQQATFVANERPGYYDGWVKLRIDPDSPCVFTRGATGEILEIPSRHGEGRLLLREDLEEQIVGSRLVPLRYVDSGGEPTQGWPDNPNGSAAARAALCDPTGRVFGLMPHPEAYLYPENHPDWLRQRDVGALPQRGFGLGLLANGVRAALNPNG